MNIEKMYVFNSISLSYGKRKLTYYRDGRASYFYEDKFKGNSYWDTDKYFKIIDKYCGKLKNGYNEPMIIIKNEVV